MQRWAMLVVAIACATLAVTETANSASPYDGNWRAQSTGTCGPHDLTVIVNNGNVSLGIPGVGTYSGAVDANGKSTIIGRNSGRSLSVTFTGDTFELHGDPSCGHLDAIGHRSG